MKRILLRAVLVAVAAAGLPGCVVSLFSDHTPVLDDHGIEELEARMDEVERRLPPPPPPSTPPPAPQK